MYIREYVLDTDGYDYQEAYASAPRWRRDKADRLIFDKDKRQSIGVWVLLDKALKEAGITAPQFAVGAHGKPYLPAFPDVHFSLSHSESRAFCVISDHETGCDVQKLSDPSSFDNEYAGLIRRFFSSSEAATVFSCPDLYERTSLFYRIWTLKESFVKALGRGIDIPFDSFSIIPESEGISLSFEPGCDRLSDSLMTQNEYSFNEYVLDDGYRYASCVIL